MSFEINTKKVLNKIELENNTNYINQEQLVNNVLAENLNSDFNNSSNTENIYYCEEEDLLNEVQDNFSYQIKERGKDYYYSGNIVSCSKNNNKYYAKVSGTRDKPYIVKVEIKKDGVEYDCTCPYDFPCKHEYAVLMAITNKEYLNIELKPELKEKKDGVEYDCTCPYDFPCKHEFAVLMAITNKEYLNIELKPELKEKKDTLQNILKKIPAEEIKKYLLSSKGVNYVCFEMKSFEDYFKKYYPNQTYEYYYNNLFNALVVDVNYENMIDSYINKIRQYVSNQEFLESFKILKSIINAYNDTNKLNFDDYIINQFPNLGMLLRIIYRKCDFSLRKDIKNWTLELESKNYYNNLYLEDIVIMMNLEKESME